MTLKKILRLVAPAMLIFAAAGCSDDDVQPAPGPGEGDSFLGSVRTIELADQTSGFDRRDCVLVIKAPDGSVIRRGCVHDRAGSRSTLSLSDGLADAEYRLLYLEYPLEEPVNTGRGVATHERFGLGCRVAVSKGAAYVKDRYSSQWEMSGSGTREDPFIITCDSHLHNLARMVNDAETNPLLTSETFFRQEDDIDMDYMAYKCDKNYGWNPIGNNTATPFRGNYDGGGHTINWLWVNRDNTVGIGLFGFIQQANIHDLVMDECDVRGDFAVGTLAGAVITAGDERSVSAIVDCTVRNSKVAGSTFVQDQAFCVGGLLGGVDMFARASVSGCLSEDSDVSAAYNAGGVVGGASRFSYVNVSDCETRGGTVTTCYSGAGGIMAVGDTISIAGCTNSATVAGATLYRPEDTGNSGIGAGGILGGGGITFITGCENTGAVKGYAGVGGLIGSTRVKGSDDDAYMYNNVYVRSSGNYAKVEGTTAVGGICGEAQFGCWGVVNTGEVSGTDYVAGVAGCTSIAVAHNAVNSGAVNGKKYVSGVVGKTTFGVAALCSNYGSVLSSDSHTAGIIGLAGNNTMVHYCANFGPVTSTGKGPIGGIVGEIGDPRKWTAMNIAECVVGGLELGMAIAGPCIAVVGHVASHAAHIVLESVEIAADIALHITDAVLIGIGIYEMCTPEEVEKISAEATEAAMAVDTRVREKIRDVRSSLKFQPHTALSVRALSDGFNDNLEAQIAHVEESEENCEAFNERINEAREERAESLEHAHELQEIIHTVISGVSLVVGTLVTVASFFVLATATGGAAVPALVLAGSAVAVVGGTNAIVKATTDYERNAVIINQCVNSGIITFPAGAGSVAGGIVGELQDRSIIRDCLNAGEGIGSQAGGHFVGRIHDDARVERCLSIAPMMSWSFIYHNAPAIFTVNNLAVYDEEYDPNKANYIENYYYTYPYVMPMSAAMLPDASRFPGWDIGSGAHRWIIPEDKSLAAYPVPSRSEMRRDFK